ncbi:MAG: UDP-N-acetylmuramate dehydrogenase [Ruminococcaceae bacterium]|nr:UDP-N-acetylmuramate dehydrogenase [Oscillospiraceae bacterium]
MNILSKLENITDRKNILINEPLKNHTTFKIGGNADYLVMPKTREEIVNLIKFLKDNSINYFVIGNGSNILVNDDGFRGVIIKLGSQFSSATVLGNKIVLDAGITLKKISNILTKEGLKGFEELSGIPGSLGGAIYMNAGAYGREIKDVLYDVTFINSLCEIETLELKDIEMKYRETLFSKENLVVLGATLILEKGDKEEIKKRVREVTKMRVDKQPLNYPSAGSTFKRPEGHFAGKLIEDANLKGYTVGGAKISKKHAGFVINYNNATFNDVITLTENVKKEVKEKFGVELELEVKVL